MDPYSLKTDIEQFANQIKSENFDPLNPGYGFKVLRAGMPKPLNSNKLPPPKKKTPTVTVTKMPGSQGKNPSAEPNDQQKTSMFFFGKKRKTNERAAEAKSNRNVIPARLGPSSAKGTPTKNKNFRIHSSKEAPTSEWRPPGHKGNSSQKAKSSSPKQLASSSWLVPLQWLLAHLVDFFCVTLTFFTSIVLAFRLNRGHLTFEEASSQVLTYIYQEFDFLLLAAILYGVVILYYLLFTALQTRTLGFLCIRKIFQRS